MAFNLFKRKRDEATQAENKNNQATGAESNLDPSDVLLTTLLRGDNLSRAQALTIPAVASNVDFITGVIASMPVKLFKYKSDKIEEVKGDSRTRLLNGDTGDTLDAFQLKKAMVEDYLLGKGGYCYIKKYRNEVTGLYYVQDDYIVIDYNFQPIYKSYKIFVEDGTYQPCEFKTISNSTLSARAC